MDSKQVLFASSSSNTSSLLLYAPFGIFVLIQFSTDINIYLCWFWAHIQNTSSADWNLQYRNVYIKSVTLKIKCQFKFRTNSEKLKSRTTWANEFAYAAKMKKGKWNMKLGAETTVKWKASKTTTVACLLFMLHANAQQKENENKRKTTWHLFTVSRGLCHTHRAISICHMSFICIP